ncbi:hypothetical protein FGE12_15490 [Aggregicoccus sp. 17bor-14]|uniref:SRPBCC domain-containing protein n=1 Tax=Myxococcaceae TaxID=31 RepID=UPI00129D1DFC|nr:MULTISPECIES: SRPBCC domain-containing protein [Myxococcaceae]MBF5043801.1 SRPBCC domain-containing protein [Simulacricoccus sp. 17bor-14]MRI89554.1 hypothetical protein [Aggregicoccus sp. 17bor-14]
MIEIVEDATVELERLLPGPAERVWEHLTQPELLSQWLPVTRLEPREGGAVTLRPEGPHGPEVQGVITRWEPSRVLAFTWDEGDAPPSEVTLELHPEGEDTRLVLTHGRAERRVVAGPPGPRGRDLSVLAFPARIPPVRCLRRAA